MPVAVLIPKATISMEEAVLLKWLKSEGDAVSKDDVLFEMETDKAVMEVPAPESGTLQRILVAEGTVRPEQVVAWIARPGETAAPEERPPAPALAATPAARRRAKELGVEIAAVRGTGPGGRITQEDVERAAAPEPAERRSLIEHVVLAWRSVPHIHVARQLDAAGLAALSRRFKAAGSSVSKTDLLLFAVSRVLPRFPGLMLRWEGERTVPAAAMDISLAIDAAGRVVAPVIHGVDRLGPEEISLRRRELARLAGERALRPEHLSGGVFTLTNLGMAGADFFAPVINHPQTAILAVGRVAEQPVVVNGNVSAGWRMWANLAVDHRTADGMAAARFLEALEDMLSRIGPEGT